MLFMVVEHFAEGRVAEIYQTFRERGRQQPEGLRYVDSWISASLDVCYQLMECDDPALLQEWLIHWEGLIRCEIVPVTHSKETYAIMERIAKDRSADSV